MSVRFALLALLSDHAKYGLQLKNEFEQRTGEVWPLNVGQVYQTLARLERDGLVVAVDDVNDGPQRLYKVTRAGRRELKAWLVSPPDLSLPPRDELVMKVLVATELVGVDIRAMIQSHRRYLIEVMQQWTRVKEDEAALDLHLALAVDAELFRLESLVRWLDSAEGRLKRAAATRDAPVATTAGARRRTEVTK